MNIAGFLHGTASNVCDELATREGEFSTMELAAGLSNAMLKIDKLEKELYLTKQIAKKAANEASCLANGIIPD